MRPYETVEDIYDVEIDDLKELLKDKDYAKHMELLADAFFDSLQRDNCEYGGIGLDSKRPFGNSNVEPDIAEIIGYHRSEVYDEDGDEDDEFVAYLNGLYNNLPVYLRYRWLQLKAK